MKRLGAVCPPAELDGEPIAESEIHRLTYDVKRSSGQTKQPTWSGVLLHDKFDELPVDTKGTGLLLSCATLGLGAVPAPPGDALADP